MISGCLSQNVVGDCSVCANSVGWSRAKRSLVAEESRIACPDPPSASVAAFHHAPPYSIGWGGDSPYDHTFSIATIRITMRKIACEGKTVTFAKDDATLADPKVQLT